MKTAGDSVSISIVPPSPPPNAARVTPTLDFPHPIPTPRQETLHITVQSGETLKSIARVYQVSLQQLAIVNQLADPNLLSVGQKLMIPPPQEQADAPEFKLISDSEMVYAPYNAAFNSAAFIHAQGGYLADYREVVEEKELSGAQIVERIAREHSVNPRLLLAVLEYQSDWVSNPNPAEETRQYPMRMSTSGWEGLFQQLNFAANELNRGYYLWRMNAAAFWVLQDGSVIAVSPYLNAGSAALQNLFAELKNYDEWESALSENGVYATYQELFGNPFDYALEPLIPLDLQQPPLQLPFEKGVNWYFTGGPHSAWGSGSAWAALDFAPLLTVLGCTRSDEWVVAAADGLIVFAENGMLIQDLDGDGFWQTGWSLLYLHIENRERAAVGNTLKAGQRIGHPSCEGGVSNGTHVHLARRYNGEWISTDGELPFMLDGWVSAGEGVPYNGTMTKNGVAIQADDRAAEENTIRR